MFKSIEGLRLKKGTCLTLKRPRMKRDRIIISVPLSIFSCTVFVS